MKTQGWKTFETLALTFILISLISGCQTVSSGSRHPFTTLFDRHEIEHPDPGIVPVQLGELPTSITPTGTLK